MSHRRTAPALSFALSLITCFMQPALAADGSVISTLIDQGKYWQSRSRSDLAAEAWRKLLRLDPAQADALYGMGLSELDKNNGEAAHAWLSKLKGAQPTHPFVARLEQAIATRSGASAQIDATRKLAQAGKSEEAVQRYRESFGDKPPSGALGLEYYQTLAGTPKGWDEARQGLMRLEKDNPNELRYALALAQHLSYRDATRAQAVARLAQLAQRTEVSQAATDAWRQALIWLNPHGNERALFEAYLEVRKDDAAIRAKLEQLLAKVDAPPVKVKPGPRPAPGIDHTDALGLRQGFAALDSGELDIAARKFEAILKNHPAEAGALGGLGVIRLRQQRFAAARALLGRASNKDQQWRSALKSASYWDQLQQADAARQAKDLPLAQKLIEQAIQIDAQEASAQIALAEVRSALKQYDSAEKLLRDVLARDPKQSAAIAAYADLLVKQEKFEAALHMLERLTPQQREQFGAIGQIRGESLRQRAASLQAKGDLAGARSALEDALAFDPASIWVRLELGRLYLQAEQMNEARSVIDGLLLAGPEQPDALYAGALLHAENQDWHGSLQALEQVPPAARTPPMASLQQRAQLHVQAERALGLARQGQQAQANALLRQAEQASERSDEQMGTLASAYAEIGDAPRALALMRTLLSKGAKDNTGLLLQYAGVLLATRQDAEFGSVLRQLQGKTLNRQESANYAKLRTGYLLRQADLVRESGDLAAAYDVLAPLIAERPDDPQVLAALARMYSAASQPGPALQHYLRALGSTPHDLELVLSALGAALDAKALTDAQTLAQRADRLDADNPRVLTGWARLYRAQGKNGKADEYYRAALAAENRERQGQGQSQTVAAFDQRDNNPFRRAPAAGRSAGSLSPEAAPHNGLAAYADAPDAVPRRDGASVLNLPLAWRSNDMPAPTGDKRTYKHTSYSSRVLPPAEPTPTSTTTLTQEASDFAQQRSSSIEGQLGLRTRAGEAGLGQLTEVHSTFEGRIAAGDGHATVKLATVALDAGKLATDYNTASRFGSGPVAALAHPGGVPVQTAAGVGLSLGYEAADWKADLGSTPLGFRYTNLVGGVRWRQPLSDRATLAIGVARRAVTDSLLAFAGTRDERSATTWGGVTASGVRFDLGWDAPAYGVYGYGQAHSVQGHAVASNSVLEAGGGLYLNLVKETGREVTTGLSSSIMSYRKNLSNMTYGNGGYFSPQSFFALNLPLSLAGTSGRLGYRLRASLGIQHFRQDDALYFPTSPALQAAAALNSTTGATFSGLSQTALAYNLGAALEYQLGPQLAVGAALGFDNGRDYRQWNGGVYMRFALDGLTTLKPPAFPKD